MKITERLKVMLKSILNIQMGSVNTDKGKLVWDGEGNLEADMEVFQIVDDEPKPAEDGVYTTEDGKEIEVVDGKVASIKDPEAEVATEEPEAPIEETKVEQEEEELPEPLDEPEAPAEEEASEEDRIKALEDRMQALVDALNEIVNSIAGLEGRIVELEGKMSKVEAPAADPVDEEAPIEEHKTRLSYMRRDRK